MHPGLLFSSSQKRSVAKSGFPQLLFNTGEGSGDAVVFGFTFPEEAVLIFLTGPYQNIELIQKCIAMELLKHFESNKQLSLIIQLKTSDSITMFNFQMSLISSGILPQQKILY